MQIWPVETSYIKSYRLPTPLLIFQIAMIPGALFTGFLLAPLLVFSRRLAQQPVRKLRFPRQKQKHRRMLAAGFYLGSVLIVGGLVGLWTRWCLGNRDPWVWSAFWLLEGRRKWSRPVLLAYWAALGSIAVAGWNRQLARTRKYRPSLERAGASSETTAHATTNATLEPPSTDVSTQTSPTGGNTPLGLTFPTLPNLPNLPNGAGVSQAATELMDAADKRVPLLSLNARRKFFHGLAVAMFLPGMALDVR
jgi:dolichol kinase